MKTSAKFVNIALAQMRLDTDALINTSKALELMEKSAENGANAICFPELQFSPFFPQYINFDASIYCWPKDHENIASICAQAKKLKLLTFANFYLLEKNGKFDCTLTINTDGSIVGISKMVHVAQAPFFYEQSYYTPSDEGFHVCDTEFGRIAVVECYDRHFPESIRTCVLKGAQLIVIPTANTTAENVKLFEWEVRVAAVQNGVFIAMCNRVGVEDQMDFCGESIVVDPHGDVISKAGDKEEILYASLDLAGTNRTYITLRRPEFYS